MKLSKFVRFFKNADVKKVTGFPEEIGTSGKRLAIWPSVRGPIWACPNRGLGLNRALARVLQSLANEQKI